MVRVYVMIAAVCFFGIASAQQSLPSYVYPVQHRSDIRVLQSRAADADTAYEVQVVPGSEQEVQTVVAYDPANVSLVSLIWDYLPSPITAIKAIFKEIITKIWKLAKFLLPVELVLLGMGSVVGLCAFTPYCTLVIEDPIASKLSAIRSSIPYINEMEYYVYEAIDRVQELQFL